MSIPREFINLLLEKVDIVDLINQQVPLRKKSGSNFFARCPFHNEKSASFSVSQPKQFYYCFGCGAHGNVIDFMMNHDRLSFVEAIEALSKQVGMEIPERTYTRKDESLPGLQDLLQKVTHCFYDQMRNSPRAIHYLKQRGISGEIAREFNIGYSQNNFQHLLNLFGKTEDERKKLLDVGLIIKKPEGGYYDRFRDRIMFPIYDYRGRNIGFGGRIIDQGEPKYLNSPETVLFQKGQELYGLHQVLKRNRILPRVIVVEGYMDVVALFQHGISYAVATLGTATTTHHLQRLARYTSEIIFCFDGDDAGRTAAWRAVQVIFPLMQDHLQIRFLFLPDGEDPDSLIRKEGKVQFENRLANAQSLSTFFFHHINQQTDISGIEGRARFANLALSMIKQLPSGIFQGIVLEELAKRVRVDIGELSSQANITTAIKETTALPTNVEVLKDKLPAPMRTLLGLLVQHPKLADLITDPLPINIGPGADFLIQLLELIKKCPNISTGALLEHWRGKKEELLVANLAQWQHLIPDEGVQSEFLGALRQLTILDFDNEINPLLLKAANQELSEEEKLKLSECINKKKSIIEQIS